MFDYFRDLGLRLLNGTVSFIFCYRVTGFTPNAAVLSMNPGNHARMVLNKKNRSELFTRIMPQCDATNQFLKLFELLDPIREILRCNQMTETQKNELQELCDKFADHLQSHLDWMPITNLIHSLVSHTPAFIFHPFAPDSIIAMSSSAHEMGNKDLREALEDFAYLGCGISGMLKDSLLHSLYRCTETYQNIAAHLRTREDKRKGMEDENLTETHQDMAQEDNGTENICQENVEYDVLDRILMTENLRKLAEIESWHIDDDLNAESNMEEEKGTGRENKDELFVE